MHLIRTIQYRFKYTGLFTLWHVKCDSKRLYGGLSNVLMFSYSISGVDVSSGREWLPRHSSGTEESRLVECYSMFVNLLNVKRSLGNNNFLLAII